MSDDNSRVHPGKASGMNLFEACQCSSASWGEVLTRFFAVLYLMGFTDRGAFILIPQLEWERQTGEGLNISHPPPQLTLAEFEKKRTG